MQRRTIMLAAVPLPASRLALAGPPPALRIGVIYRHLVAWTVSRLLGPVFEQAGIGLALVNLPSARAELIMSRGEVDGEAARIPAYGRLHPELIRVDPPIYRISIHAYTLRSRRLKIDGLESLRPLTVGYQSSIVYATMLAAQLPRTEPALQPVNLFRMLEAGRVHAIIDASLNARRRAAAFGLQADESPALAQHDVHIYLRGDHADPAARLSAAIRRLIDSGRLAELTRQAEAIALHLPPDFD